MRIVPSDGTNIVQGDARTEAARRGRHAEAARVETPTGWSLGGRSSIIRAPSEPRLS
jgi:hypothetical protein